MSKAKKPEERKLRASLRAYISAMVFCALTLIFVGVTVFLIVSERIKSDMLMLFIGLMIPLGICTFVCWVLSIVFNLQYRKSVYSPSSLSDRLLKLTVGALALFSFFSQSGTQVNTTYTASNNDYQDDQTKTFVDEDKQEHVLTHTYDDVFTQHYQGQDGSEWVSHDGGETAEKLVTNATVTDKDGKVYELRAVQAGLDNFIDQNGDMWTTYDGRKTFERR